MIATVLIFVGALVVGSLLPAAGPGVDDWPPRWQGIWACAGGITGGLVITTDLPGKVVFGIVLAALLNLGISGRPGRHRIGTQGEHHE